MTFKSCTTAAAAAILFALPALADGHITISEPYMRVATSASKSGAAFMVIENSGDTDDRLVDAASEVAARVELHTHTEDDDGVMRMRRVEDGFAVPAGGSHALARGGDHVMFMGLARSLDHGDSVDVTLTFEQAGEIEVTIPVDLERD